MKRRGAAVPGAACAARAVAAVCALIASAMCGAHAAAAHVPQLRGRLVDLVSRSDLIVVGTIEAVSPAGTRMRVAASLVGALPDTTLTFRAQPRLAKGERYVVFLRREDGGLGCIQPAGAVFPARSQDDAAYRAAVGGIAAALSGDERSRAAALRAVLIAALRAPSTPLRYHAALDLAALAHHGLSDSEQRSLEGIVADPTADPALRPVLIDVLREASQIP